jgi:hypothetical protein
MVPRRREEDPRRGAIALEPVAPRRFFVRGILTIMRNPSWFAFQALQGAICGLAGWSLAPKIASAMLVGPVILFMFWMIETVLAIKGVQIYVQSEEESAKLAQDFEDGAGPGLLLGSLLILLLAGSGAAGLAAAACTSALSAILIGVGVLFTIWGVMFLVPKFLHRDAEG